MNKYWVLPTGEVARQVWVLREVGSLIRGWGLVYFKFFCIRVFGSGRAVQVQTRPKTHISSLDPSPNWVGPGRAMMKLQKQEKTSNNKGSIKSHPIMCHDSNFHKDLGGSIFQEILINA